MVALQSLIGAFAGILPVVAGAALPAQESKASLLPRWTSDTSTWDKYHETNRVFAQQGLCMSYVDRTERDGLWACREYCKDSSTIVCWTPIESLQHDYLINHNPNGERWVTGQCHCDTAADKLANIIVDFTARGLDEGFRQLGTLTCSIMMNLLKEAALAGAAFIPGAGPGVVAARTMAKTVKLAAKTSDGKDIWTRTVEGTCGVFDERQTIESGFEAWLSIELEE